MAKGKKDKLALQIEELAASDPNNLTAEQRTTFLSWTEKGHPRLAARAMAHLGKSDVPLPEGHCERLLERHLDGGAGTDPGCEIKLAVVRVMAEREQEQPDLLKRAAKHIQLEAAWGDPEDTAAELRGAAFGALCAMGTPDLPYLAVDMLCDQNPETRRLVIQNLGDLQDRGLELLLRFKLRVGDSEPSVLGACFDALMAMNPSKTMALAADYLDHRDVSLAEAAALAIGESRHEDAFTILARFWREHPRPDIHRRLILPIALIRGNDARNFLLQLLEDGNRRLARDIFHALRIYVTDDDFRSRLLRIVKKSRDSQWRSFYSAWFAEYDGSA